MKTLTWFLIAISFIGIADSSYLSHAALTGTPLNCGIFDGCNTVAASPYSKVFGIPLALFGLAFYLVALALAAILLTSPRQVVAKMMFGWSILGVLFSAYFMYLQYFIIEAICLYCLISAVATLLLLFSYIFLRKTS